jgi:hypothetical protein
VVDCAPGEARQIWRLLHATAAPDRGTVARTPVWRRWWFWTIAGAVAAGTATAVAVGLAARDPILDIRIK